MLLAESGEPGIGESAAPAHPEREKGHMIKTQASTLISSPAERVFDFIAVDFFKNYRRWSPEVVALKPVSDGPVQVGTTARQIRIDQGRQTESTFKVSAFVPGKRVDFQGLSNPFYVSYQLESIDEKTRLTFVFQLLKLEFYMRPFEKLIRSATREGAHRVVHNIKGLLESEGSSGPNRT